VLEIVRQWIGESKKCHRLSGQLTTDHADRYSWCGRLGAETERWRSVTVGTYG
jgi:hypothetical protein